MLVLTYYTSHRVEVFHPNSFLVSCGVCVRLHHVCERLHVIIPGGADGGDGGGSQGDAVQPALLQQRCVVIGVLSLKKKSVTIASRAS